MKRARRSFRRQSLTGFSLVELMVAVTIAVILLAIGIPNFHALIQRQKITTTVNNFFASINLARSEAIQRGIRVDLVPIDHGRGWGNGWIVFIDKNNNQRPEGDEQIIFTHDSVPSGLSITATLTDSHPPYIAYTGTGRTRTNASSQQTQFGTLTFQLDKHVRKIKLNFLGRPRICDPEKERSTC